jgi:hypothetical protein
VRHDDIGEQQIHVPYTTLLFQAQGLNAVGRRQHRATQPLTTASRPFCTLVGHWKILVDTASPFSRTAAILDVVAPLSIPM